MADKKPVRVVVTGGSGMLGRAVSSVISREKLANEHWFFLSSKDADLRDLEQTKAMFENYQPTHVLHLAAMVGGLFHNMTQNLDFFMTNMAINSNVLKCCHDYKVKKAVSCMSTCAFPDQTTYPLEENMLHLGPPHDSIFGYSYAKRMIDILNRAYHQQYGDMFTSVIPCNIFGAWDNFNLINAHVIPALIHKFYLAKVNNQDEVVMFGSGTPRRQFIYSLDLARLMVWVLREYEEIEPINLTVGEEDEVSIREAVDMIGTAMGFKGTLRYDATKADGQLKKTASIAKIRRYLPHFKFTPIQQAIQETCDWFCANYAVARK